MGKLQGDAGSSGKYTPTLGNTTNIAASTAFECQWMRVGNVVTVSGRVDIDVTSASVATAMTMSLPIASTFTGGRQLGGVAAPAGIANGSVHIIGALGPPSTANFSFIAPTDVNNLTYTFSFTYFVQ
jgi:hypothetical protein